MRLPKSTFAFSQTSSGSRIDLRDQLQRIAARQLLLDLALELRVEDARGEHEVQLRRHVLRLQARTARQQAVVVDEGLHRVEQRRAHAGLVRAARRRRNEVHVALARGAALLVPGERPRGALAFGERLPVLRLAEVALAGEDRHDRRHAFAQFLQVVLEPARIRPRLRLPRPALLDVERDRHAGQQHRLRAQQPLELRHRHRGRIEVLRVGMGAYRRPRGALPARPDHLELFRNLAALEDDAMHLAVALHLHLEAPRQRVGHGHADAVQAARERIGALAAALVELAAGVQAREHDLDGRDLLFRMDADGNAAAVVLDADRAVRVHADVDAGGLSRQRLVGGVVDDFLDDVRRIGGPRVHAGPLADRLQALQHADRRLLVSSLRQALFLSLPWTVRRHAYRHRGPHDSTGRVSTGRQRTARRQSDVTSAAARRVQRVGGIGCARMHGPHVASIHHLQPRRVDRIEQLRSRSQAEMLGEVREDQPPFAAGFQVRGQPGEERTQHAALGIVDPALDGRARTRGHPGRIAHARGRPALRERDPPARLPLAPPIRGARGSRARTRAHGDPGRWRPRA